jgi:hypothetical protein
LFKSKTKLNLNELDPNSVQSYNSNKSSSEEETLVNMANNNINDMENDKDRFIREYAVFNPNTLHPSTMTPKVTTA